MQNIVQNMLQAIRANEQMEVVTQFHHQFRGHYMSTNVNMMQTIPRTKWA